MPATSIIDQHGDDAAALPRLARYADLVEAGVTTNWTHLARLIREEHFPPGFLLSRNIRCWDVAQIKRWLSERPAAPAPLKGAAKAKHAARTS